MGTIPIHHKGHTPVIVSQFGETNIGNPVSSFRLSCGEVGMYFEALIDPLPTLSISALLDGINPCRAILVIEQGDGLEIERELPNTNTSTIPFILVVPNVRRVFIRCEDNGGDGCTGQVFFHSIQYCGCTQCSKESCSCRHGSPVVITNPLNTSTTASFNVPCGGDSPFLFESFLSCAPTVTIVPRIQVSFPIEQQCDATLVLELENGEIIERNITPRTFPNFPQNASPIILVSEVRRVWVKCRGELNVNCNGTLTFGISYC